jgi:maltose alpha-D-glucosyltransferase/alpha-amylase
MTEETWYKDAILYEVHVRAFYDSNGDGVGDFPGLVEKLDYLQSLGVTGIWLLPFYPSPLKDDGYDIADYTGVNPSYGTLRDVKRFVREAHRRGLRVITELVCNHTSDQHPWFQRARRARPGSAWRNYYVWSDTPDRYQQARIIFKDFEASNWAWDATANAYYWHRFYYHQPDLNYDNPLVRKAIFKVVDFWLEMGVDGLRLDAIPYLFERDGTNCENLPETHSFLRELRAHIDRRFPNRMLLGEANQWPEEAAEYFGDGDECHMAFHFPVMPRLFMAIRMEDRFPIVDILAQTPEIPETSQWALFLRNHDELTLEMVTDEERDYMYRVYTQDREARINLGIRRRLAPLLANNRRRVELMNGLLFSLPGTPVIYYGDEIGMGDNIYLGDRNGVRTPMQWSSDRNAGFSRANRQRLYLPVIVDPEYHFEAVNVEAQEGNSQSLLAWMKRLIAMRKRYAALGRGSLEFLHPDNRKVLAFIRHYGSELILVVANLSRFSQAVELDLSNLSGLVPVEMFGRTEFPPIGDLPYFITLGPHGFYWFSLELQRARTLAPIGPQVQEADSPELVVANGWRDLFDGGGNGRLPEILPSYLQVRRWFGGKARRIKSVQVRDVVGVPYADSRAEVAILEVQYTDGDPESYVVPFTYAAGERAEQIWERAGQAVVARIRTAEGEEGILYDAMWEPPFCEALLDAIARRRRFRGAAGAVAASPARTFRNLRGSAESILPPSISRAEQSNNSVVFGERLILKLYRRIEEGVNPELEVGRFLTERTGFAQMSPVAGSLEYLRDGGEPLTLGILQGYVPNQGDAWSYTLDALDDYFDRVRQLGVDRGQPPPVPALATLTGSELPAQARETIGEYLRSARLLGTRTAEMHLALASDPDDPQFASEPSTMLDQRSVYQAIRALAVQVFGMLRNQAAHLPDYAQGDARAILALESEVLTRLRAILQFPVSARRIRCHGDYHLGQVLYTGHDFVIIDFEGEPARTLRERRLKRWPMKDVAGMLRSFHYAAQSALADVIQRNELARVEERESVESWAQLWYRSVSSVFQRAYLDAAGDAAFMPRSSWETAALLESMLMEKALYELRYELNNRPGWVPIPLKGILELVRKEH